MLRQARSKAARLVHQIAPRPVWNAIQRARGSPESLPWVDLGAIQTAAFHGRVTASHYAELYEKYRTLDPTLGPGKIYTYYNAAACARLCSILPGDFVCAGISYGVAARIIFDFVNIPALGKTLHLVDPFDGRLGPHHGRASSHHYNRDPDTVLRQYPPDSPVAIHQSAVPIKLNRPLAFVFMSTSNPPAAAEAIPEFYADLVPGGMILSSEFDQISLGELESRALWLPSGQGIIIKQ